MSAPRTLTASLLVLTVLLVAAAPAAAELGPIKLVSKGASQPADSALAPALSADGRYLAFQGSIGGWEGIFRRDLQTGVVVKVAVTDAYGPQASTLRGRAPSISADGRYVSFTTSAQLDPANDTQAGTPDVYRADLATGSPTYELVSALDGCDPSAQTGCGLTYAGSGGSEASGRVALSADGSKVVFFTAAISNLGGVADDTPALQVVLRNLATDETELVSVERDPGSGAMTTAPVQGGALVGGGDANARLRGAALSADGSTVAWLGANIPAQVPLQPGEAQRIAEAPRAYDEPLWRRIATGVSTPTRRVVAGDGGADPFPDLTTKNTDVNQFQGWLGVDRVNGVPQLSADGTTVALIGNPTEAANLFLVDMAPGLSRAQAVRQLTRETVVDPANPNGTINRPPYMALTGHVFDLALSADGRRLAFATARQRFPLAPPNLVSPPPSGPGLVELYLIDRDTDALLRLTHGTGGPDEPSIDPVSATLPESASTNGLGAASPSFGSGGLIAFSSTASNLVAEDSNEASDAFLVEDAPGSDVPGLPLISPPPTPKPKRVPWKLTLTAFSQPDGDVRLVAGVPAAGRLRARVAPEPGGRMRARTLGETAVRAKKSGGVPIELELPGGFARLARTREGVYAVARVSFQSKGRKTLRGQVQIRFHVHAKKEKSR